MFSVKIFLQVIFVTVHVSAVLFQDCGSVYRITSVSIQGCDNRVPCFVTLGRKMPVTIEFLAASNTGSLRLDQNVLFNINFINLQPVVSPEHCESGGCIIKTDNVSSFTSIMLVPMNMALNQRGWLEWRVFSEGRQRVLCYRVLVQTQNELQAQLREAAGPDAITPLPILLPDLPNIIP